MAWVALQHLVWRRSRRCGGYVMRLEPERKERGTPEKGQGHEGSSTPSSALILPDLLPYLDDFRTVVRTCIVATDTGWVESTIWSDLARVKIWISALSQAKAAIGISL